MNKINNESVDMFLSKPCDGMSEWFFYMTLGIGIGIAVMVARWI